jgi:O-antigen chain-terminating methyltransferase
MLRTGDLAKIEILGRMRLSPEGRAAAVRVTGLLVPFTLRTLRRIPVLGHVLGVLQYVLRLPIIVRNHERLEAVVFFQQLEMRRGINAIDAEIEAALRRFRDSTATSIDGTRETILAHDSATSASFDRLVERLESITERVEDKIDRPEAMAIERRIRCEVDMLVAKFMSETTAAAAAAKADIDRLADELSMRRADAVRTDATREDPDHLLDDLYVSFEDTFRGTREDIKKRVEVYLPYIRDAGAGTAEAPVLDIGCGRGEWLELLEDNGLAASGVDTNRISSAYCRERGLVVAEVDNLDHLRGLESASIGAVTAIHVIEHIPFPKLMLLFDEVRRVLKPGGVAIFETPNPENLVVGACNFWYDPTHQQPLPPEPMRFVLDNRGFTRVEILRLHPMTDMSRLTEASNALPAAIAERFYGPQDYALVGYKP